MSAKTKPRVWNKRGATAIPAEAVYIGRPGRWGNPFRIGRDGDRAAVVAKYRAWVFKRPELLASIREHLRGKDLVCWCAPEACHGDVLLEIANGREG